MVHGMRSAGEDREITLTADEADQLLVILNDVVVSLDRMGSRRASGEDPEHIWIHEYFTSGGATRRLAYARYLLDVTVNRVYTEDEQVAMWDEREWPAWSPSPADE